MTADNLTALPEVTHGVVVAAMNALIAEEIRVFGQQKTPHNGARCETMKAALTAALPLLLAARDAEASFVGWWREDAMTAYTPGDNIGEFLVAGWKPVGIISPEQMSAALQADTARAEGVDRG